MLKMSFLHSIEQFSFFLFFYALSQYCLLWSQELLLTLVGCACPPRRLQYRALSLPQSERSVPAPAEHLHQQQQHIRRNIYNHREPCRAGERSGKTRETPTSPTTCSAPKQTLKVGSHQQHQDTKILSCFMLNHKQKGHIVKIRMMYISMQEKEGLCGEPAHMGGRHTHWCRWYCGEDRAESELCGCQQQWRCVEKKIGSRNINYLAPLVPLKLFLIQHFDYWYI